MAIEAQDDIGSSGEVQFTSRFGLPQVPRNNTKALAALNAIARIIDSKAVDRNGDVLTGDFVINGTINASGDFAFSNLRVGTLVCSGEANIAMLYNETLLCGSGEFTDVVAENGDIRNLVVDTITARIITADQTTKTSQTDIKDLSSIRGYSISYPFIPTKVTWDVWASGETGFSASGTTLRNGSSSYVVTSGESDSKMGVGVPRFGNVNAMTTTLGTTTFFIGIDRGYPIPTPITARIIAEK